MYTERNANKSEENVPRYYIRVHAHIQGTWEGGQRH